ncbi:DDB1- and CUL4-associated factor 6-like [Physella acuta]|uniref:DDB1- and CUL4-associated factor 6-like n=1 Tax=Physella acuta TaxID=109671 RepID=UPI0027DC3D71|nr:DDB1- and CUL4-associated factor 6-like [Physella acuta]
MFSLLTNREHHGQNARKLYNTSTGSLYFLQRLKLEKKLAVHDGCVNTICWNDSGTLILSGSDDQHLAITNPFTGKNVVKFRSGHRSNIFSAKFLPGSMDREVVSCSGSGEIFYTDVDREDTYGTNRFDCHFGTAYKLLVVPNEAATFLSCGDDGTVRFFDLRTKTSCSKFNCEEDVVIHLRNAVTAMAVDPIIPFHLAVASSDGMVRLYDRRMLKTRETGGSSDNLICKLPPPMTNGEKRPYRITSLNYRPGSHDILVNYSSENIYLFNTYDTKKQQSYSAKPSVSGPSKPTHRDSGPAPKDGPAPPSASASIDQALDSESAFKPIKRLRLRGDWSDTGPDARPESEEPALTNTIMQRMSDLLTRMLNSRNERSESQDIPEEDEEEAAAEENRLAADINVSPADSSDILQAVVLPTSAQTHNSSESLVSPPGGESSTAQTTELTSKADPTLQPAHGLDLNHPQAEHDSSLSHVNFSPVNLVGHTSDRNLATVGHTSDRNLATVGHTSDRNLATVGHASDRNLATVDPELYRVAVEIDTEDIAQVDSSENIFDCNVNSELNEHTNLYSQTKSNNCSDKNESKAEKDHSHLHRNSDKLCDKKRILESESRAMDTVGINTVVIHENIAGSSKEQTAMDASSESNDSISEQMSKNLNIKQGQTPALDKSSTALASTSDAGLSDSQLSENSRAKSNDERQSSDPLDQSFENAQEELSADDTYYSISSPPETYAIAENALNPCEGSWSQTLDDISPFTSFLSLNSSAVSLTEVAPLTQNILINNQASASDAQANSTSQGLQDSPVQRPSPNMQADSMSQGLHDSPVLRPSPNTNTAELNLNMSKIEEAESMEIDCVCKVCGNTVLQNSKAPATKSDLCAECICQVKEKEDILANKTEKPAAAKAHAIDLNEDPVERGNKGKGKGKSSLKAKKTSGKPEKFSPYNSGKMRISLDGSEAASRPSLDSADFTPSISSVDVALEPDHYEVHDCTGTTISRPSTSTSGFDSDVPESDDNLAPRALYRLPGARSISQGFERQRRAGYSLPPTGSFQLHSDDDMDMDDDEYLAGRRPKLDKEIMSRAVQKIQEAYRKKRDAREAAKLMELPQPRMLMKYSGHRNCRTMIKEANFYGDHFVISGSDCGRILAWDRETGRMVMYLDADKHVVNCVQPNMYLPVLASSGIDYDIKIWSPLEADSQFEEDKAEKIIHRNELMLEETRDTVTVPAAFMLRILASLSQIRTGRNLGRGQAPDPPGQE